MSKNKNKKINNKTKKQTKKEPLSNGFYFLTFAKEKKKVCFKRI